MKSIFILMIYILSCKNGDISSKSGLSSSALATGWYYVSDSTTEYRRQLDETTDSFYIEPNPVVTVENFTTLKVAKNKYYGSYYLAIKLDRDGTKKWSIATKEAMETRYEMGKSLAFILDDKLLYTPRVVAQITNGKASINRGTYSKEELESFKRIIEGEK